MLATLGLGFEQPLALFLRRLRRRRFCGLAHTFFQIGEADARFPKAVPRRSKFASLFFLSVTSATSAVGSKGRPGSSLQRSTNWLVESISPVRRCLPARAWRP